MALRIVFDQGVSTTCSPGSVLSGHVELIAPRQQSLGGVSVTLAGRCKVRIRRSSGQSTTFYHSKGYYFSQYRQLHQGDFTFQAGTYKWPFRFIIPPHADRGFIFSHKGKGDIFNTKSPWRATESEELHPLPPTFCGPTSAGSGQCSVEYYLKAEMAPGASLFGRTIDTKATLQFRPSMLDPSTDPGFHKQSRKFPIQTLKLLPEDCEERHSFRHKLKGVFSSSSLPEIGLEVMVSIPRRVVAAPGTAFPCLVSVRHCASPRPEDPRQVPQSSVLIRRFELELRSHTEARTRSHHDHKRPTDTIGAGSSSAIAISGNPNLSSGADQAGHKGGTAPTDVGAQYRARLPQGVTPDFSTYNIAHYHTLELKLRLECAGQGMTFDINYLPLEVTPQVAAAATAAPPQDPPPAWEPAAVGGNGSMPIEQHGDDIFAQPPPPSYMHAGESQTLPRDTLDKAAPSYTADEWE